MIPIKIKYDIHSNGTIKARDMENFSAAIPMRGGIKAPPAIHDTIKPDNSFVYCGIRSIVSEKTRGKILANPRPTRSIPVKATGSRFVNMIIKTPARATSPVIKSRCLGATCDMINEPENLPRKIGR